MLKQVFCILISICFSCTSAEEQPSSGNGAIDQPETGDWNVTVIHDGLIYPWEIRRSGSTLIITETEGNMVMINNSGSLTRYPLQTSSPVARIGGSGLMGLALANDFAMSGTAYVYYTYRAETGLVNRIAQVNFNGSAWRETNILLDGIPGHQLYNGGRIAIGPDGFLYATTGWTANSDMPQTIDNLAGKVLRLNLQGQPAAGNPFPNSYIYSFGHRNPQGIAWDMQGQLYVAEHGQAARDEINIIIPGGNYGWPLVQGDQQQAGMITPHIHTGHTTLAPSGIAFTENGKLIIAALGARAIYTVDEQTKTFRQLLNLNERARAVLPYEDGLYLITTNTSPQQAAGSSGIADRLLWIAPKN